jgi:hypothetical protein
MVDHLYLMLLMFLINYLFDVVKKIFYSMNNENDYSNEPGLDHYV